MRHRQLRQSVTALVGSAALLVVGLTPAAAGSTSATSAAHTAVSHKTHYRQLLGTVTGATYLEASVPTAGTYAIEYDITTTDAAYFDTYINGTELGYVGGVTGRYVTRAVQLSAGGQLVQVLGPDGSGSADVYIVSVRAHHRN